MPEWQISFVGQAVQPWERRQTEGRTHATKCIISLAPSISPEWCDFSFITLLSKKWLFFLFFVFLWCFWLTSLIYCSSASLANQWRHANEISLHTNSWTWSNFLRGNSASDNLWNFHYTLSNVLWNAWQIQLESIFALWRQYRQCRCLLSWILVTSWPSFSCQRQWRHQKRACQGTGSIFAGDIFYT